MKRLLLLNFSIASAYAMLGWAALALTIPPGYSLPVFPAAGLALAAVLTFGRALLPAVALGSAAVQWMLAGDGSVHPLAMAAVPLGAVVQAAVGAHLLRRRVGYPTPLDTPGDIVQALGVVAPTSSLVSASVAIPALTAAGILAPDHAASHWSLWWIGDTLGVIIALPVALAFVGSPREDWRHRRVNLVVPLGVALGLLSATLWHLRTGDAVHAEAEFQRSAAGVAHQIGSRIQIQIEMLRSAERLMAVSPQVDRQQWHDFVTPWFERHPGMLNFTWNPLVREADRPWFVAHLRGEGFLDFDIHDRGPDGTTRPAGKPPDGFYLPITYLEPLPRNATVFGLNPLSIAHTGDAIRSTLADGHPRASKPFRLTQETGDQIGVVLYQGVRQVVDGHLQAIGLVSSALRIGELLDAALPDAGTRGVEVCLRDIGSGGRAERLSADPSCAREDWDAGRLATRSVLEFAGRAWEVRLRAHPRLAGDGPSTGTWGTIVGGLASIGLLGAFLLLVTGRTRRIQELVELRTAELAAASRRLLEQQGALAEAQRIAGLGSWQLDPDGQAVQCSDECRRILGSSTRPRITLDDLVASVTAGFQPRLRKALEDARQSLDHSPHSRQKLDCEVLDGKGLRRVVHILIEGSRTAGERIDLRGTVQDVTSIRDTEARIQRLADYDGLTGLPNRGCWTTHARNALATAGRHGDEMAVLFIDLDNFKTVNDSLGHQAGDHLLTVVARRLESLLREGDMLARLGGDEFVALLPRLGHRDEATAVADKLLSMRERPVHVAGHELPISMSIGIALFPEDGIDVDTLLKNADMAMYDAKGSGRNTFQCFRPEMNARAHERLQLDNALHRAIAEQQLFLMYQPQVDVAAGRVVGYEALLRWRHPELGLVAPDRFVPVAEVSGLIVPIGDWVMRQAFLRQLALRTAGESSRMAINISAIQFRRSDFLARVEKAIADTGVDPADIEFEITESALMDPTPELLQRLEQIRRLGIRLALDDFGTGYSSLTYLKRLPIQALKIDRSFVSDLPGDTEDAAIASATLSMASDLGVDVVAEGVETAEQRAFLQQRGCRLMQGYLFSRPVESDALPTRELAIR